VKAEVFVPRMEGPSMSLEEFGELQLRDLKEREANEARATQNGEKPVRR
jgi:hypothetical protein